MPREEACPALEATPEAGAVSRGPQGALQRQSKGVRVKKEAYELIKQTPPPDPPTPQQAALTSNNNIRHASVEVLLDKKCPGLRWGRLWPGYLRRVRGGILQEKCEAIRVTAVAEQVLKLVVNEFKGKKEVKYLLLS